MSYPRMTRVFIISQEEPFFIPKVVRHVLEKQGIHYTVVGATRLKPHRKNKRMWHWFVERSRVYTTWELILTAWLFVYCKLWRGALFKRKLFDVDEVYREFGINQVNTADVSDPTYVEQIRDLDVDVIVSVSPPQLLEEPLLSVPKHCINAHGTLLPRHRGVFGSWWTIYLGDKEAGATIHTMVERLDAGDIVWQEAFSVTPSDTQFSIAFKTKRLLALGLVHVIQTINHGRLRFIPPAYDESYHRAPTKSQGKDFHKKGKRILTIRDFKCVRAKTFDFT